MSHNRLLHGAAVCAITTAIAISPSPASAEPGDGSFYFFGDSALSMGNFYEVTGVPHDPRYSRDGFIRRESNGPVWAETLTNGDLSAALDPSRASRNINYAFSSAQSGCCGLSAPLDEGGVPIPIGVHSQLDLFGADIAANRINVSSDDLFFVAAGGNDVLDRVFAGDDWDQIGIDIANNSAITLQRLASAGAKTIFFETVPDVDVIPPLQAGLSDPQRAALRAFTGEIRTAQGFAYDAIAGSLPDDVQVVSLPLHEFVNYATDKAASLGLAVLDKGCIDANTNTRCSTDDEVQDTYLFWDSIHLTTAAQALQADFYGAFMDAGLGDAGRSIARIPDFGLLASDRVAAANLARLWPGASAEKGFRVFLDGDRTKSTFDARERDVAADLKTRRLGGGGEFALENGSLLGFSVYRTRGDATSDIAGAFSASADEQMTANLKMLSFSGYGRLAVNNLFFDAGVTRSALSFEDISRAMGAPLLNGVGETEGRIWRADARAGVNYVLSVATISPYLSLSHADVRVDGYSEHMDGLYGLSLAFEGQTLKSTQAGVGVAAYASEFEIIGQRIQPWFRADYARELGDGARTVAYQFNDNWAGEINLQTTSPAPDKFDLAAGLRLHVLGPVTMDISYERTFAGDQRQRTNVRGAFTLAF